MRRVSSDNGRECKRNERSADVEDDGMKMLNDEKESKITTDVKNTKIIHSNTNQSILGILGPFADTSTVSSK